MSVEEWKQAPIAILGAGAVGKAVGADSKLAGNRVHLFDLPEFAKDRHIVKSSATSSWID
ncbi:TPA: hypothetical protein ACGOR9_002004 [Streptococcus suis]